MEKDNSTLYILRHSTSHIMAQAVQKLFPNAKLAIGPAIENGFYYDIDMKKSLVPEDFEKIEREMAEIIKKDEPFNRKEVSKQEALKMFASNPYKCEIINELKDDEVISVYYTGNDFVDLCRGPHVESTKYLQSFAYKINRVSGAYWRGNSKNKMLQRIYGVCFKSEEELNEHLNMLEEARMRDHRKIGKNLSIFMSHDLVGKGMPLWLPNGAIIRKQLENYIYEKDKIFRNGCIMFISRSCWM